jgi:hypothetical protein
LSRQRLRTNLTFGAAKTQIAQQASKQNTAEFLTRAGTALQKAVQYWNRYNWRYLLKQAPDFSIEAGDATIATPWDLKDVYDLRVENAGREHALVNTNRRLYDRLINNQSLAGEPAGYDLAADGSGNVITFTPPADTDLTMRLKYYRRMWVPCHVSGVLATLNWTHPNSYLNADGVATLCTFNPNDDPPLPDVADGYMAMADVTLGSPVTGYVAASGTAGAWSGWSLGVQPLAEYPIYTGFDSSGVNAQSVKINIDSLYPVPPIVPDPSYDVPVVLTFGGDGHVLDMPVDFEDGILAKATAHFLAGLGAPEGRLAYFLQKAEDELQEARRFNEEQEDQDTSFEIGAPPPPLGRFRSNGWV